MVRRSIPGTMKDLRNSMGLTQEQFAAKVGVTFSIVSR